MDILTFFEDVYNVKPLIIRNEYTYPKLNIKVIAEEPKKICIHVLWINSEYASDIKRGIYGLYKYYYNSLYKQLWIRFNLPINITEVASYLPHMFSIGSQNSNMIYDYQKSQLNFWINLSNITPNMCLGSTHIVYSSGIFIDEKYERVILVIPNGKNEWEFPGDYYNVSLDKTPIDSIFRRSKENFEFILTSDKPCELISEVWDNDHDLAPCIRQNWAFYDKDVSLKPLKINKLHIKTAKWFNIQELVRNIEMDRVKLSNEVIVSIQSLNRNKKLSLVGKGMYTSI